MRRGRWLVASLLLAPPAWAADHLVSPGAVDQAFESRRDEAKRDRAVLDTLLTSPAAERAARSAGTDTVHLRSALDSLTEPERHDLAQRARALQADPRAGLDHDVEELLIIFLAIGLLILVIRAA